MASETENSKALIAKRFISKVSIKRLLTAGLLFWVPVIIFIVLAEEVREKEPIPGDSAILQWLNQHSSPELDKAAVILTDTSGSLQAAVLSAIIITVLLALGRKRAGVMLLFSIGGASVINVLLKLFFARDRPDLWATVVTETSYSFPSGHAMGSAALAFGIIALLWDTKWRYPALVAGSLYTFLIGMTRLYLGVHYPTDVVAGWAVSLAWVIIVKVVLDHYAALRKLPRSS